MGLMKWLFGKKEKEIITKSIDGVKLSNKDGGDYNPFASKHEYISSKPLTIEEMKEQGFTSGQYVCDSQTGYYAWVYEKNPNTQRHGCSRDIKINAKKK